MLRACKANPWLAPLVALLLSVSFTAGAANDDVWTQAIIRRDADAVRRLANEGVDVNRAALRGQTALMLAAAERDLPLIRLLVERGADVNARNNRGGTALMYSATAGDVDAVKFLLANAAAADARATNGWTALTLAAARGFEQVAAVLLAQGADPNVPDIYGWTPLMRAVQQERPAVVKVLLAAKRTDLGARNENGRTALHQAALGGFTHIARMLVEHGADPGIRDRSGYTPAALATANGHAATAKVISDAPER